MTETVVTRLPNAIISFVDNVLYFSYTLDKFSVDEIISKAAKVTSNCFHNVFANCKLCFTKDTLNGFLPGCFLCEKLIDEASRQLTIRMQHSVMHCGGYW